MLFTLSHPLVSTYSLIDPLEDHVTSVSINCRPLSNLRFAVYMDRLAGKTSELIDQISKLVAYKIMISAKIIPLAKMSAVDNSKPWFMIQFLIISSIPPLNLNQLNFSIISTHRPNSKPSEPKGNLNKQGKKQELGSKIVNPQTRALLSFKPIYLLNETYRLVQEGLSHQKFIGSLN